MWYSVMKKVQFNGPDGLMYYWHDSRKRKLDIGRRTLDGGSVIMWGAIFYQWEITVDDSRRKSNSWIIHQDFEVISSTSNSRRFEGYQQEDVAVHKLIPLKCGYCIKTLRPLIDLLIILIWTLLRMSGVCLRGVYANWRMFSTIDKLRSFILTEWKNLETETIKNLITSMSQRCFSVINDKGCCIWSTGCCLRALVRGR